jgi:hypothetical protein
MNPPSTLTGQSPSPMCSRPSLPARGPPRRLRWAFVEQAWDVLEPGTRFIPGVHVGAGVAWAPRRRD